MHRRLSTAPPAIVLYPSLTSRAESFVTELIKIGTVAVELGTTLDSHSRPGPPNGGRLRGNKIQTKTYTPKGRRVANIFPFKSAVSPAASICGM